MQAIRLAFNDTGPKSVLEYYKSYCDAAMTGLFGMSTRVMVANLFAILLKIWNL